MSEYDFILNTNTNPRPQRSGSNGMLKRILVVLGGLMVLTIILSVVFGVLLKADKGPGDRLVSLYATQTDIVALTKEARSSIKSNESAALASGVNLVITSDQLALSGALAKIGRVATDLEIAAGKDAGIRELLTEAKRANRYDETFDKLLTDKLTVYRASIRESYLESKSSSQKEVLDQAYSNVTIILNLEE